MNDLMFLKIIAQNIIEIFCAIINTKYLDFCLELCLNHGMEIDKYKTNLSFIFKQVNPTNASMIINKSNKPFCVRMIERTRGPP